MDLFEDIEYFNKTVKKAVFMFSGGRDSIVLLSLLKKYAETVEITPVFMYFVKGLSFQEKILKHYEKLYDIQIERIPHNDVKWMMANDKKRRVRQGDVEAFLRNEYNISMLVYGYRKDESLQRRGMLAHLDHAIDWKFKKAYPLAEWREPHIRKYVQKERLILPDSYRLGYRDINSFKGEALMYVYYNFPEDYKKIIEVYPLLEAERVRFENYGEIRNCQDEPKADKKSTVQPEKNNRNSGKKPEKINQGAWNSGPHNREQGDGEHCGRTPETRTDGQYPEKR
jgi:phosphoadenosine phosphosulfate reductase